MNDEDMRMNRTAKEWRSSYENKIDVLYREIYNLGRNCEGNLSTNENSGKQPKIENSIFNENITGKDG